MHPDNSGLSDGPALRPARILVLDDEPMIRDFVGRALEMAGYEVVLLSPPHGAVEFMADARFDLVVTNSIMPAQSGARLVAQLRREFPDIPVIHLDDLSHPLPPEFPLDVLRLDKPFSTDALVGAVSRRLGR
jgi:DNA-binding NtrC family response regulator